MPKTRLPKPDLVLVTCRGKHDGIPCPLQWVDRKRVGMPCFYCKLPTEAVWKSVRTADGSFRVDIMMGADD